MHPAAARALRAFAGREVFFLTHMSSEKMIKIHLRLRTQILQGGSPLFKKSRKRSVCGF
jgi:hypothetical protein